MKYNYIVLYINNLHKFVLLSLTKKSKHMMKQSLTAKSHTWINTHPVPKSLEKQGFTTVLLSFNKILSLFF